MKEKRWQTIHGLRLTVMWNRSITIPTLWHYVVWSGTTKLTSAICLNVYGTVSLRWSVASVFNTRKDRLVLSSTRLWGSKQIVRFQNVQTKLELIETEIRRMISNNVIRLRQKLLPKSKTSFRAKVERFRKNIPQPLDRENREKGSMLIYLKWELLKIH